jgi:hypothetical protein
MRISGLLAVPFWMVPVVALAQAPKPAGLPTENVTVNAPSPLPESVLRDFVKSYSALSQPSGKIARWRTGACPITTGLPPAGNTLVTARIREIAAMAGAPASGANCKPNIDIVFTLNPQVLMDQVRTKQRVLLGYHEVGQEKSLATMTHPVQAWYTTQTVDLNGQGYLDKGPIKTGMYATPSISGPTYIPDVPAVHVTGNHLDDGLSSELFHVIVVIDLARVKQNTVGALADYVAMLALARTEAFETCQPVPSISNLVSAPCDAGLKTDAVSASDLAYLRGLYSVNPHHSYQQQKDDIAFDMKNGARKR